MTLDDLSRPGWRHYPGDLDRSTFVAGGERRPTREVGVVVTRLSFVGEHELGYIVPEDRTYVAAEMHAFLLAWLTDLHCPVVNRPTPMCLSGPMLRPEEWVHRGAALGMRVRPQTRVITLGQGMRSSAAGPSAMPVTVVGDELAEHVPEPIATDAHRLARSVGADLLTVWFDTTDEGPLLLGADPSVALEQDRVAELVVNHVESLA